MLRVSLIRITNDDKASGGLAALELRKRYYIRDSSSAPAFGFYIHVRYNNSFARLGFLFLDDVSFPPFCLLRWRFHSAGPSRLLAFARLCVYRGVYVCACCLCIYRGWYTATTMQRRWLGKANTRLVSATRSPSCGRFFCSYVFPCEVLYIGTSFVSPLRVQPDLRK